MNCCESIATLGRRADNGEQRFQDEISCLFGAVSVSVVLPIVQKGDVDYLWIIALTKSGTRPRSLSSALASSGSKMANVYKTFATRSSISLLSDCFVPGFEPVRRRRSRNLDGIAVHNVVTIVLSFLSCSDESRVDFSRARPTKRDVSSFCLRSSAIFSRDAFCWFGSGPSCSSAGTP